MKVTVEYVNDDSLEIINKDVDTYIATSCHEYTFEPGDIDDYTVRLVLTLKKVKD